MELFLVRHGQSVGNIMMDQDLPDSPLTELGLRQAERAAAYLSRRSITRIISSPLIRALQTARPLANAIAQPIEVWLELHEHRKEPSCKGATRAELLGVYPEALLPDELEESGWHYAGTESETAVRRRAAAIARRLRQFRDNERLAVFAHGTLNEYLIREFLRVPVHIHVRFEQSNTGVNHFTIEGEQLRVHKLNDTVHLNAM